MKYKVNDEFVNGSWKIVVKEIDLINKLYLCSMHHYNSLTNHIYQIEKDLDGLCQYNNWQYVSKSQNANINLPSGFKIDTPAIYNDCSHLNIQEKILFTSTYKVCQDCKKEL